MEKFQHYTFMRNIKCGGRIHPQSSLSALGMLAMSNPLSGMLHNIHMVLLPLCKARLYHYYTCSGRGVPCTKQTILLMGTALKKCLFVGEESTLNYFCLLWHALQLPTLWVACFGNVLRALFTSDMGSF